MALFCDRCGFRLEKGKYIHSRHTGKYYCTPLSECERKLRGDLTLEEATETGQRLLAQIEQNGWEDE